MSLARSTTVRICLPCLLLAALASSSQAQVRALPAAPPSAPCEPPRSGLFGEFPDRAIWLEGHVGAAAPLGVFALALDVQPVSWLALNVGAGLGLESLTWSAMPRLRLRAWKAPIAFSLGGGYSSGAYAWDDSASKNHGFDKSPALYWKWDRANWANVEFSMEGRWLPAGARFYVGYSKLLNPGASRCTDFMGGPTEDCNGAVAPSIGRVYVGASFAFGSRI